MLRPLALSIAFWSATLVGQQLVSVQVGDGKTSISADLYGNGPRAVILAHGGRFDRGSWREQAQILAQKGFAALAISFRGDHPNPDGSPGSFGTDLDNAADVLAAAHWFHTRGITSLSAVGGSLGGTAVGNADSMSPNGTFDRLVLLASEGGESPAKLNGRKLFLLARDDANDAGLRLKSISAHYQAAPEPKQLIVLDGSAHAQFLFATKEGPRVMDEIVRFLSAP